MYYNTFEDKNSFTYRARDENQKETESYVRL